MLLNRKSSKYWYAKFRQGEKQIWICLKTTIKSDAIALHDSIKARLTQQRLKARVSELLGEKLESPRPLMIKDVEKKYTQVNPRFSLSGLRIWRLFRRWYGQDHADISDIDLSAAMAFLGSLRRSGKRHNNCKSALSKIWRVMKPFTNIDRNFWLDIPNKPADSVNFRPLKKTEIKKLLDAARDTAWHDAILVALHTGLRKKDVLTLRKSSVHGGHLELYPAKTAKYGRAVFVPVHRAIAAVLRRRCSRTDSAGHLFPELWDKYDCGSEHRRFEMFLKTAGISDDRTGQAGFHSLRTTFITRAESQGVPRHVLQGIVGHHSPAMTEHYSHDRESAKSILGVSFV